MHVTHYNASHYMVLPLEIKGFSLRLCELSVEMSGGLEESAAGKQKATLHILNGVTVHEVRAGVAVYSTIVKALPEPTLLLELFLWWWM